MDTDLLISIASACPVEVARELERLRRENARLHARLDALAKLDDALTEGVTLEVERKDIRSYGVIARVGGATGVGNSLAEALFRLACPDRDWWSVDF